MNSTSDHERKLPRQVQPRPAGRFQPEDFAEVIACVPAGCPLVGGQAVAWWAIRYGVCGGAQAPITSADIDFWGSREELKTLAKRLARKPIFPNQYEMTVWVGAVPLNIQGKQTLAEFLHVVPGLDVIDPEKASVEQEYRVRLVHRSLLVLSPISLVVAKLHALRHFDQAHRQDELHLKVSLQTSRAFLNELLDRGQVRHVLWNSERLAAAHRTKPYRRLQKAHAFDLLDAIPIDSIRQRALSMDLPELDRQRLARFAERRWKQLA